MKTLGIVITGIGVAYALLYAAAGVLILACRTAGALRRRARGRRMDREIAAIIAGFSEEEVAQWFS